MQTRTATPDDLEDLQRVWREVGWVDDDDEAAAIAPFLAGASSRVAIVDGHAEALAAIHRGTLQHTGAALDLAAVTAVTTSRVGRRRGLARTLLAEGLAEAAADGAVVAALGMFEQGFYDTVGFGTGTETLFHRLDPDSLDATLPHRPPVRLGVDDAAAIAACMAARRGGHGAVVLPDADMRRAELQWSSPGFGLGYRDDDGTLTHFVWCTTKGEHGPYRVAMWAWQEVEQLRELLGLVRSLGDQVRTVSVPEPQGVQLQVLTRHPGRQWTTRDAGEHRTQVVADAWWQARILDLPACLAALRTTGARVGFALDLRDPVTRWTAARPEGWQGVSGHWRVELGPDGSTAEPAAPRDDAPTLRCDVNALTRLWLGVRAPSVLAASDDLEAPPALLEELDGGLAHLPRPDVGMDF